MRNGEQNACNASRIDARRRAGGLRWVPGACADRAGIGPAPATTPTTAAAPTYLLSGIVSELTSDGSRRIGRRDLAILTCRGESRPDGMTTQVTEADGTYRVT